MAILKSLIEGRAKSVLQKHFKKDVEIDFIFTGTGKLNGSSINLNPFACVLCDFGLAFIHNSIVILNVRWERIVSVSKQDYLFDLSILIKLNESNILMQHLEYPWSHYFELKLNFNEEKDEQRFLEKYRFFLSERGASEVGIEQLNSWSQYIVRKPVELADYLKLNLSWNVSDEKKKESYRVWGEQIDAEKFFYFIGMGVCRGQLPPRLISVAKDNLLEAQDRMNSTAKSKYVLKDKLVNLVDNLEGLAFSSESANTFDWAIGKIEVSPSEEKCVIEIPLRWTTFILKESEGWPVMHLLDHYNEETPVSFMQIRSEDNCIQGELVEDGRTFEASKSQAEVFRNYCSSLRFFNSP